MAEMTARQRARRRLRGEVVEAMIALASAMLVGVAMLVAWALASVPGYLLLGLDKSMRNGDRVCGGTIVGMLLLLAAGSVCDRYMKLLKEEERRDG